MHSSHVQGHLRLSLDNKILDRPYLYLLLICLIELDYNLRAPTLSHDSVGGGGVNNMAMTSHDSILQLQQTIGNQAVQRLLRSKTKNDNFGKNIQAKLKVSQSGDVFEQEADLVAEHIIGMSPSINSSESITTTNEKSRTHEKCSACEMKHGEKERQIGKNATTTMYTFSQKRPPMRKAGTAKKATRATDVEAAGWEGESLPREVRRYFEPRFGWDFSKVHIHADSDAAHGAQAIQARAYTLGRDIVFGAGEYTPATNEGRRLIAHELAHVVEQEGGYPTGHASGATIRRQPLSEPTKHKVTQDEVVQTMTGLGGPYTDTAAWEATMQSAKFLGHTIDRGVRAEFKTMLATAETKVKDEYKISGNTPPPGHGITYIGGYRREISPHGSGVAIDIDGGDNPYIMHEDEPLAAITDPSKQTQLSKEVGPVYTPIAQFMGKRCHEEILHADAE